MKQITKTYTVYSFDELSEDAKQKAIENLYDINVDYDWWSYDDSKEIASLMGIDIENIYFSGFSSQGDGACFEGSYTFKKNGVKNVKSYAPLDKELHQIAERLQDVQKKHFYKLSANVKHSGHYYHEMCTEINVYKDGNYLHTEAELSAEDEIKYILRDYMRWIYRQLEKQYDYLTSEKAIIETIEANEYTFLEDGTLKNF